MDAPLPPLYLPPAAWWAQALAQQRQRGAARLALGGTYSEKCGLAVARILGAQRAEALALPVAPGSVGQPLAQVALAGVAWPRAHARALETAYRKSAFWDHYGPPLLAALAAAGPAGLLAVCQAGIRELGAGLGIVFLETDEPAPLPWHPPPGWAPQPYRQTFGAAFVPDLSGLDALLCLGPRAAAELAAGLPG